MPADNPSATNGNRITWKDVNGILKDINQRLDDQTKERHAMEQRLMTKLDELCIPALVEKVRVTEKDIGRLETRINAWSLVNSLGVGVAVILDYLGIRRP